MNPPIRPSALDALARFRLHSRVLDDSLTRDWFFDICQGRPPRHEIPEETAALAESIGLVRHSTLGWTLAREGRQFARDLGLIPGPVAAEVGVVGNQAFSGQSPSSPTEGATSARRFSDTELWEAWRQFARRRDTGLRNALVEHYLSLVRDVVAQAVAKLPEGIAFSDLMSAGLLGLVDAVDAYDPNAGTIFEHECVPRIRGAILGELRAIDWTPRLPQCHTTPDVPVNPQEENDVARRLRLPLQNVREFVETAEHASLRRLAEKLRPFEAVGVQRAVSEPEGQTDRETIVGILTRELSPKERLIIVLYYYEGQTMKEIAEMLGLPESRAWQMHSSIVERIRARWAMRASQAG